MRTRRVSLLPVTPQVTAPAPRHKPLPGAAGHPAGAQDDLRAGAGSTSKATRPAEEGEGVLFRKKAGKKVREQKSQGPGKQKGKASA